MTRTVKKTMYAITATENTGKVISQRKAARHKVASTNLMYDLFNRELIGRRFGIEGIHDITIEQLDEGANLTEDDPLHVTDLLELHECISELLWPKWIEECAENGITITETSAVETGTDLVVPISIEDMGDGQSN